MATAFDETLVAAADTFFLLPGAEWIDYFPDGGSQRRIQAVITRTGPDSIGQFDGGSRPVYEALVKNDDVAGIASDELDTGGDKLQIAPNVNEKPITVRIVRLINHDAGHVLLLVQ
jgi:hypothetical protein